MTVNEGLDEVKRLIEKGWIQGTFAKDAWGLACPTSQGVCFCLIGAMVRAEQINDGFPYEGVGRAIREQINTPHIPDWNDAPGRTKEEVLELLEKAKE